LPVESQDRRKPTTRLRLRVLHKILRRRGREGGREGEREGPSSNRGIPDPTRVVNKKKEGREGGREGEKTRQHLPRHCDGLGVSCPG